MSGYQESDLADKTRVVAVGLRNQVISTRDA